MPPKNLSMLPVTMSDVDHNEDHQDGHSPRKRRRLGSTSHTPRNARDHKQLRLRREACYRDEYRVLFNDYVTETASRALSPGSETMGHFAAQLGSSQWSATEKAALFAALDRLGRHDLPGIAAAVATKTLPEVRAFLTLLRDAAASRGHAKLTLRHIPAAVDIGGACAEQLDDAADALAWYQECLEADQEQKRHGDYWLITPAIAAQLEVSARQEAEKEEDDDTANPDGTNSRGRPTPTSDLSLKHRGRGVAGACLLCKERKKKCDRKSPCAYCVKSGVDCVYSKHSSAAIRHSEGHFKTGVPAIPEAALLNAQIMLKLSREIFMNRCPDFPSPWMHWSQYTSELAAEPSIYRTAFNDFHTLVVSITRRLVQTTITQATSRLRAQRHRNTKTVTPLIKLRDTYSAMGVLGLARNGQQRWRGVSRRCGLKVFTHKNVPKRGKEKHDLSWSDVERALSSDMISDGAHATQSDASIEPDDYKSKMARSGTPLPMHNLILCDPKSDSEHDETSEDDSSDASEHFTDGDSQLYVRGAVLSGGSVGRSSSVSLNPATYEITRLETAENIDYAASKEEEHTLSRLLGFQTPSQIAPLIENDRENLCVDLDEKIVTAPDDWEGYCDYQAPWEKYTTPVPGNRLLANHKPSSQNPGFSGTNTRSAQSGLSSFNNTSPPGRLTIRRRDEITGTELHARGTNAYAAWRRDDFAESDHEMESSSSSINNLPMEDIIAQSVEFGS